VRSAVVDVDSATDHDERDVVRRCLQHGLAEGGEVGGGAGGERGDGEAQAPRAETYRFVPEAFYNTYSAAHPPALHVKPGDRVITRTVDAAGVDLNGKTVATGPNPQTGPFYVDGAEPDDMLVVTFEKIEPNRVMAYSASLLSPYAVTPQAIAARVDREPKRLTWSIDKAKGVARLDHRTDLDVRNSNEGRARMPLRRGPRS